MKNYGKLRPILKQELELIRSWRNSDFVRKNMYSRHLISQEEHLEWWESVSSNADKRFFIFESNDIPLGFVCFTEIDKINQNAFWAFYSSPDAPKGTGVKMEFQALDYYFENLALNKLSCEVLSFNRSVINLHKKFGFITEGIFKNHHKYGDDYCDIYRMAIFKNEWKSSKENLIERLGALT